MTNIFVFTQNLKLDSFRKYAKLSGKEDKNVFLTTHFLFENERAFLSSIFPKCVFMDFADFFTDAEMAKCDRDAYTAVNITYQDYLSDLKRMRNTIVADKALEMFLPDRKYILSRGLGIDYSVWEKNGFTLLSHESYHMPPLKEKEPEASRENKCVSFSPDEVSVAHYKGKKYVFIGKMHRIAYRLSIPFEQSEDECEKLNAGRFEGKETCIYMTTDHEHKKCRIPDDPRYAVRWTQDGYLPPNYTAMNYHYAPNNVVFYCWDIAGSKHFTNHGLPCEMIPFRKKLYLPEPVFPTEVKYVLIVGSASGNWTAHKNRSDDDIMVDAFAQMAKRFPGIHFTYRCHPTLPLEAGVNAINRIRDYFESLGLPNLTLSSNIPAANADGNIQRSFSRNSLDEDLKMADLVFGEHSISMIDAGFKRIPFCSVNLTNRRNLFIGINELGFPTVSSHDGIATVIESVSSDEFRVPYFKAVENYNKMTDVDDVVEHQEEPLKK